MAKAVRSFSDVKDVILSCHKDATPEDKMGFYDKWADNYEQDVAILDYRAPGLAADALAAGFQGDRENAVVLDVACGTGLVASRLQTLGFRRFVGVDGSEAMLRQARDRGLYQELLQCMLGSEELPVPVETYNAVLIVGALSVGQVPLTVIKDLWKATKPGGYVCMTTRGNTSNKGFKDQLECLLKKMETEGLWTAVSVTEVQAWERAVSDEEAGYIPGAVYLYRKTAL
ncbi:methyltransferase-like protein 27 [Amia ocellicauda]|uniref:methyltransferase-like protein 27 n=1 Tax=Amia ocellicauda TaxID=2972642 RepID=UPI003463E2D8